MNTEDTIDNFVIDTIRNRGGKWAAYQNAEIGHPQCGHIQFLPYGPGCSFLFAPDRMPDTHDQINWRYMRIGYVDLELGEIVRTKNIPHPVPALSDKVTPETTVLKDLITGDHLALYESLNAQNLKMDTVFMTIRVDGAILRSSIGNDTYPGTLLKVWAAEGRISKEDHDQAAHALKIMEEN